MTFLESQNEVKNRLSISAGNPFWTDDMIKQWLNIANVWACAFRPWAFTEGAKKIPSVAGKRYYDYPISFRSDSLTRLSVADSSGNETWYQKVRYDDFMNYLQNNPDGTDKIFTDYRREYFINPVVDTDGLDISVWGQQVPDTLVNDDDITPFTEGAPEGEEAIIKKALAIALKKSNLTKAEEEEKEAILILQDLWSRISKNQASYHTKDTPFFNVPDYFK